MSETGNIGKDEIVDDNSWVVHVKSALGKESGPDESHGALICAVPQCFKTNSPTFYHPSVISFGPYHFKTRDPEKDEIEGPEKDEIEGLKSEVARKMHLKKKGGLDSVIEEFMKQENQDRIKKSYAKEIKLSSEVCAWMIVRDACFVLEVLDRFREGSEDAGMSIFMESILSRKRHHPLLTEIVNDMLKMENQLPFWVLEKIKHDVVGSNNDIWFESALKNLSPIKVAEGRKREYISYLAIAS